ncbi:MAG: carbohydrate ABC transporter permease [Spartobacteria bacterium]|nr:carbohydrate ABC transporter permease [Spartobacteria bacterium]
MNKQQKKRLGTICLYIGVLLVAFYMLFPFLWALSSSFKDESQLQMVPATVMPRDADTGAIRFSLANYKSIFTDKTFLRGFLNSCIVAGGTTMLALSVGSFAAFALGKLRFKGRKVSLYVILMMTMFPQVTVLTGLYAVITALQMPAIANMILSYMLFTLPFTTWVLTSFFKELPEELLQSGRVDGATSFQTFRYILLPLTAPAMVTTGLLAFIAAWNEYLFALTFTAIEPSARTIPVAIALFTGTVARQEPFGEIMAAAVIVTVPIILLVLYFQRRIVAGLTSGAVKG